MSKPTVLIIMDGYALTTTSSGNAIAAAKTPVLDHLFSSYPWARLHTSGQEVGLMPGQMGDSNVGHLNIGAGRIVNQTFPAIMQSIEDGSFVQNKYLKQVVTQVQAEKRAIHIMGLMSDGGVHSHIAEVYALLELISHTASLPVYLHTFLDGRDVPPKSARTYLTDLEEHLHDMPNAKIATITGRYYAMDRDQRWERTERTIDAMMDGKGHYVQSPLNAIKYAYNKDLSDEFVEPTVIVDEGYRPVGRVLPGDSVIFINFRADRARQISKLLLSRGVKVIGMAEYDKTTEMPVIFSPPSIKQTLGEVVSQAQLQQLRVAETEKYAHVTFFLNGGREAPYPGEKRILIPSPKVATYDLQPEMSADVITSRVLDAIEHNPPALIVVNYANCDMVGHTGNFEAAVQAVEVVDTCVGKVVNAVLAADGCCVITADHGNADQMLSEDQQKPHTAHTKNDVPCIIVSASSLKVRKTGRLADIAPTVLSLMHLEQPSIMTGQSLLNK